VGEDFSKAVLITGCSTGIGRATAEQLARTGGVSVYATARQTSAVEDLEGLGCRTLRLDVTDEASMREAVEVVEREHGAVGVLINNAGYGLEGAVEELPLEELRRQFETNLFGPTRLVQLVVPGMRRQHRGRIINVSSVGGRITTPGNGAYHASKHALEALSDVLRFELQGFGIDMVVVEPGAIASRWVEKAVHGMRERMAAVRSQGDDSPYAELSRGVADQMYAAHEGLLGLLARPPEAVARVVDQIVRCERPRTRYVVPAVARLFIELHAWLPDRAWDALMRRMYPSPGIAAGSR
jgi:NAD(P)-dependent dehydrogenase (short-subunit alcohol dehydrogenase family)